MSLVPDIMEKVEFSIDNKILKLVWRFLLKRVLLKRKWMSIIILRQYFVVDYRWSATKKKLLNQAINQICSALNCKRVKNQTSALKQLANTLKYMYAKESSFRSHKIEKVVPFKSVFLFLQLFYEITASLQQISILRTSTTINLSFYLANRLSKVCFASFLNCY